MTVVWRWRTSIWDFEECVLRVRYRIGNGNGILKVVYGKQYCLKEVCMAYRNDVVGTSKVLGGMLIDELLVEVVDSVPAQVGVRDLRLDELRDSVLGVCLELL